MHFLLPTVIALLSAPFVAYAQNPNPFKIPAGGLSATGGKPLDLEWTPTTDGTVSLILRSGQSSHLDEGTVIASKIENSGSYTWTPSNSLTKGDDYAVEIVDDANPELTNYTPQFPLDTTTTEAQTTSKITLGAVLATTSSGASSSTATSYSLPIHNTFTHKSGVKTITTMSASASGSAAGGTGASPTTGGAARVTAMAVGMVGVALGALAL